MKSQAEDDGVVPGRDFGGTEAFAWPGQRSQGRRGAFRGRRNRRNLAREWRRRLVYRFNAIRAATGKQTRWEFGVGILSPCFAQPRSMALCKAPAASHGSIAFKGAPVSRTLPHFQSYSLGRAAQKSQANTTGPCSFHETVTSYVSCFIYHDARGCVSEDHLTRD
jgi:hypothetical protein